jgi:ribosomal-protein-alanine N-acetyltransferase
VIAVVKDLPPRIRAMHQADIELVSTIEAETYDFPWSAGIFRDCLLAGYTSVVLDRDGEVCGYGIMSIAAGEAHLLNICVADYLRRQGIGRRLLKYLLARAKTFGAECVFLEVRPSNEEALALYDSMNFEIIGVRRNYYKALSGHEDAVVLVHRFDDPEPGPS